MATENLKVKITADASQAKAEIGKFKDTLKSSVSAGDSATKTIAKLTAATGALAVAIKAVKSAVKNAVQVAAMGDAIKDNAQKVFMGTTAYQEWGYVLKQNGIERYRIQSGDSDDTEHVDRDREDSSRHGAVRIQSARIVPGPQSDQCGDTKPHGDIQSHRRYDVQRTDSSV